ncbi:LTA synthase family protein [Lonepinella sp. MS14437]|uniref:LTA synthase family protein n=1 Tax=Lonepinella sp. MS14437 TaxID=3003620 RepID=UPI0036DEF489
MFKRLSGPIYPLFIFFIVNLILLSISRLGLSLWQSERIGEFSNWVQLFLNGIRIDISALCWLFSPLIILSIFFTGKNKFGQFIQSVIKIGLVIESTFLLFMEFATPAFINTYDLRPNRLFVEYLVNPKEVLTMLWNGHLAALISAPILTALCAFLFWKLANNTFKNIIYPKWHNQLITRPLVFLLIGGITFLGARSSLEHRGINPAMVAFSPDPLVNSLVLSSGYSLLFAIQQMKDEGNAAEIYGKMPLDEVISTLKAVRNRPESDYISTELPTLSQNQASYQGKPKNLVIILEESLGAQFIGTLGGKPLSPKIDELAKQGWLFENLYATGTRSVRGIEAVTAGFTPTPARSVVKLPGSQQGFFTIAELLSKQGYHTSFIYGGEKHFDNMASFFYGNGFQQIIDEKDYVNPHFTATWGVSDEDLFNKANDTFNQLHQQGKPFFSLVFTSSNHDPFEFPAGKIDLYEQPQATRNNAAKYADFATGRFFDLAKQSDYWNDTIFLIIADHDSRVGGAALVPVQHFHIPALILGKDIEPRRDPRLVSQIDMPTTLLSLIGISANYPMLGYDLTRPEDPNRALMQYDKTFGYMRMQNNQLETVILQQGKPAESYVYSPDSKTLTAIEGNDEMKKQALAYSLWGSYAYKQRLYQLGDSKK